MSEFEGQGTQGEIGLLQAAKNRFDELIRTPSDIGSLTDALKETEIAGIKSGEPVLDLHIQLAEMANQAASALQNPSDAEQFIKVQEEHKKIIDALRPPTPARRREKQPSTVGAARGRAAG